MLSKLKPQHSCTRAATLTAPPFTKPVNGGGSSEAHTVISIKQSDSLYYAAGEKSWTELGCCFASRVLRRSR